MKRNNHEAWKRILTQFLVDFTTRIEFIAGVSELTPAKQRLIVDYLIARVLEGRKLTESQSRALGEVILLGTQDDSWRRVAALFVIDYLTPEEFIAWAVVLDKAERSELVNNLLHLQDVGSLSLTGHRMLAFQNVLESLDLIDVDDLETIGGE